MPSTHAPIKKYNYERSLFRWVMSRHPEPFEKHGITTRTLERAPLAREAFYTSDWPGARALVQSNDESKYERTAFFDAIIERGLRNGTRFSIDHVTNEEKTRLGITMDRASGKYYLAAYGSPKARRTSSRRGSQTSSDGDALELPHMVIKEVEDMITAEIEAAGENPEVLLVKKSSDQGTSRGSRMLHFSVSIRRRNLSSNAGIEVMREKGEGAGAGPPLTQAADAGAGKTTATSSSIGTGACLGANPGPNGVSLQRQGSSSSTLGDSSARSVKDGGSPRQTNGRETVRLEGAPGKPGVRSPSNLSSQGNSEFSSESSPPKKRKSITQALFSSSRLGGTGNEQVTAGLDSAGEASMEIGRAMDVSGRSQEIDVKPIVRLQSSAPLPTMYPTTNSSSGTQFNTVSSRHQDSGNHGFSSWGGAFPPRGGMRTATAGHISSQTGTNGGTNGSILPSPPLSSWHMPHPLQTTRSDDLAQVTGRSGIGRTSESASSEGGVSTTASSVVSGPMTASSQQQQHHPHLPSMSFGSRPTGTTVGRLSPSTMVVPEQSTPGMPGLSMYQSHVRQSQLMGMGSSNLHGGTGTWSSTNRISGPVSNGNREGVDEEDIDFLASFF